MLCISSKGIIPSIGFRQKCCDYSFYNKIMKNVSRSVSRVLYGEIWLKIPRDSHSSGTDVTTRLVQPTRMTGPEIGCKQSSRVIPIRSCSRWGLPCHIHYWMRGGLLPRLFTLTCLNRRYISVALSLRLPSPDVIRHRYSVEPGLSSPFTFRYWEGAAARPTDGLFIKQKQPAANQ